jgi:hypothetical protein
VVLHPLAVRVDVGQQLRIDVPGVHLLLGAQRFQRSVDAQELVVKGRTVRVQALDVVDGAADFIFFIYFNYILNLLKYIFLI